ncbi:protein-lysine N-methyltransferase EEF2KMT [Stomoxys calcitrans]|uniref:protein-lysine N-methyltransferase EEF2KMT n=1 Tax=Stomoxys calcitrans TaxID=35570 RepID=UPI0027E2C54C|nr:protein-lysine N-methyltransferase EEF2KMT [Stomoxys calcitrans]
MPENSTEDFKSFLIELQKQFLCCYPLHCIEWQNFPKNLTWDQQKQLMDFTCNSPLNQQLPIKVAYQLNFLKKLITFLEQNTTEVHDEVYESYCQVQQKVAQDSTQKYAFKHYILSPEVHFTLRESKSFVAEGTTGLCSWQASLALADFMLHHPDLIRNKSLLELGAGTGLCGFILYKMCDTQQVILSDGSPQCVDLMCESVRRNFPSAIANSEEPGKYLWNEKILQCSVIPWDGINDIPEVTRLKPDILLAADVVYDDSCFEDLSFAIDFVFQLKQNQVKMFLAATVRNEHTLNGFLRKLDSLNFMVTEEPIVPLEESFLYWDRSTPVKVLRITR